MRHTLRATPQAQTLTGETMKNVLSDAQKYQLANWLMANKDKGFSRASAIFNAFSDLGFNVTYSNMTSAEHTTGVSLVKVPKVKEAVSTDHEARIAKLENELEIFKQYCRVPIPESLLASYIKPSANKPIFCRKHG